MDRVTIKRLKLLYLVMFVSALAGAITHGIYSALDVFFREPFPEPWNVFNEIFYMAWPVIRFTYMYCFITAFPMLALIHRCEEHCLDTEGENARRKANRHVSLMVLQVILSVIVTALVLLVIDPFLAGQTGTPFLWIWQLVTIVIFIAFAVNLPRIAGTVNDDIQEFHAKGYHVHESVFGIIFIIAGILFLFNIDNTVDLIFAAFFFVTGGFLFGRDIKDVMAGKFIEKVNKKDTSEKEEQRLF